MELKHVHLFIMFSCYFGQLGGGVMDVMKHHLDNLQEHGYLGKDLHLTEKGEQAIAFAVKKAGEV